MRIALGQFNATVGDLAGNAVKIREIYGKAVKSGAELIVFPELALCGYPPEDLLLKKHFLDANALAIADLAADCPDKTVIVGFAESCQDNSYNSAAILKGGKITAVYRKSLLPNYGVFDEKRYFRPGNEPAVVNIGGLNIAITICADIWDIEWLGDFLKDCKSLQMVLNISASPFHMGKSELRLEALAGCARKFNCAVAYCNLVGGQDELVFDGRSMLVGQDGTMVSCAAAFEEDILIADIDLKDGTIVKVSPVGPACPQIRDEVDAVYRALILGTRDYVRKNGFEKVLLGLSGGIDSSVVAAVAADALSSGNVIGITMPSRFNSKETQTDAERLAKNLGIKFMTIPIEPVLSQFDKSLQAVSGWNNGGIAYENLQARIRGSILMSLSNQLGAMVLTTGNKSETAVGYTTLYGDTAGGFAVIKDVPKTLVYKLAAHINGLSGRETIPADVINRPPTAELRPGQKDADTLPEYDLLDRILSGYIEQDKSAQQLVRDGLPQDVVYKVIRMVDRNEYKRRQSPPGVKITPKAFGRDWRLPITNHYRPC